MKLNHLILVICTGILVGFSACKKDPFTEADAIAAQKELITMKYGYELQLKNIEAAIQKAHDDAQITMKNLDIKGASDLSKQEAAQQIAYLLANLESDKQWYAWQATWQQKFEDSVTAAHKAAKAAADIARAWSDLATTYNSAVRILDNGKAISGATLKVLNFDGVTFYTATSDANGYIYVKNLKALSGAPLSIVVPNTASAVYPIYYSTASALGSGQTNIPISSYDPTTLKKITGTVYASLNLTNNNFDGAGAGVLVTATQKILSENVNSLTGKKDTITLSFPTSTLSTGAYSLSVPATTGALASYTLTIPKSLSGYQRAYTLVGSNPYQALPTVSDSIAVKLAPSGQNTSSETFNSGTVFYASYFMSLPKSEGKVAYSATLTDPVGIIPELLKYINPGGANSPDGSTAADSSLSKDSTFKIDAAGFLLNNGHLSNSIKTDSYIVYDLPQTGALKDSTWKDTGNLNPDSSTYDPLGAGYSSKYFTLKEWLALSLANRTAIMTIRTNNGVGTFTPTTKDTKTYGNDTLAVSMFDLTGRLVTKAPEFIAVVSGAANTDAQGNVQTIELLKDANHGLFNITAVLKSTDLTIDTGWFTNWYGRSRGRASISSVSGLGANDYTRSGLSVTEDLTSVDWNYGALFTDTYFNATGVKITGTKYGAQIISGSARSYITSAKIAAN